MHLLVSEQYIESIMHGATIKVMSYVLDFDHISSTFSVEFDISLQMCLTTILGTIKLNLPITAAIKC